MKAGRDTWLHVAAIVGLTLVAYAGSFDGDFVLDDVQGVQRNAAIRSLDWQHVRQLLTSFDGANFVPLVSLSFAIDYAAFGSSVAGYHATNLLLHVLCALLLYRILTRMELPAPGAAGVALLWAVHPLQVESVAWISERKNTLSGVFFFAAFLAYLRYSESGRLRDYLAVATCFVFALLSKMNTMVLPALFLAYEVTYRFRLRRRDLLASIPLFGLAALVGWYNLSGNPVHGGSYPGGSILVTWLSSSVVVFRYLGKLLVPVALMPYYEVTLHDSVFQPAVALSVLGLLGNAAAVVYARIARRAPGFWVCWFFLALAPMLNIVPFRSLMQDRYMYLASVGPLALGASLLAGWRMTRAARRAVVGATAVAAVICVGLTLRQVEIWSNPLSIYKASAQSNVRLGGHPRPVRPDHAQRIAYMEELITRVPSAEVHSNLAALYYSAGRFEDALRHYRIAVDLGSRHPNTYLGLGRVLLATRHVAAARVAIERAVELAPYDPVARMMLVSAHRVAGDAEAARAETEKAVEVGADRDQVDRFVRRELASIQRNRAGGR